MIKAFIELLTNPLDLGNAKFEVFGCVVATYITKSRHMPSFIHIFFKITIYLVVPKLELTESFMDTF